MDAPSPDRYVTTKGLGNTHVITFGVSREASARRYLKNHPPRDRDVPGPAAYAVPPKFQKESVSYTMRPKTKDKNSRMDIRNNPGPGAYNSTNALNPEGKYSSSALANPKSTAFAPKSS